MSNGEISHIYTREEIQKGQVYWIEGGNVGLYLFPEGVKVEAKNERGAQVKLVDEIAKAIKRMPLAELRKFIEVDMGDAYIIRGCMRDYGDGLCLNEVYAPGAHLCRECKDGLDECEANKCDCKNHKI